MVGSTHQQGTFTMNYIHSKSLERLRALRDRLSLDVEVYQTEEGFHVDQGNGLVKSVFESKRRDAAAKTRRFLRELAQ